ncbi:hypothetical protein EEJ42_31020, partial [Streptomyces botrytidirepellens]
GSRDGRTPGRGTPVGHHCPGNPARGFRVRAARGATQAGHALGRLRCGHHRARDRGAGRDAYGIAVGHRHGRRRTTDLISRGGGHCIVGRYLRCTAVPDRHGRTDRLVRDGRHAPGPDHGTPLGHRADAARVPRDAHPVGGVAGPGLLGDRVRPGRTGGGTAVNLCGTTRNRPTGRDHHGRSARNRVRNGPRAGPAPGRATGHGIIAGPPMGGASGCRRGSTGP